MAIRVFAMCAVLLVGCSRSTSVPIGESKATVPNFGSLDSMVGKQIELHGRFDGPGKLADYIATDKGQVYLTRGCPLSPESTPYGTEVIVRGVLQHYAPPPVNESLPPNDDTADRYSVATLPEHYYIESAQLVAKP